MASIALSRRVGNLVGYPPLCEMSDLQRRKFHEALLDADELRGSSWEAAGCDPRVEQNRPKLRVVTRH